MKIESVSLKSSTIVIFTLIGLIAIILSLIASSYFKQSALNAQMNSLSRVIEVAAQETIKQIKNQTFDIGMKLGHSKEIISATKKAIATGDKKNLIQLLDDPFINGFVGFSKINLRKFRIFNLQLKLISESSRGTNELDNNITDYIAAINTNRSKNDRLKAIDALWMENNSLLFSTLVPIGGLHPIAYLEIIVDPVFNFTDIGNITKTPVRIYSMSGEQLNKDEQALFDDSLPIEFILHTSDKTPSLKIIGYENIENLNKEMKYTQLVTVSSFLLLSLITLLFALWLFNKFMFTPVSLMIRDMAQITHGKLDLIVNNKGLKEFHILANAFNTMNEQVRMRTNDLQRLLDLDDSALMCFDQDYDVVYYNKGASHLFGYSQDESSDLELADLFSSDILHFMQEPANIGRRQNENLRTQLTCKHKDGHEFQSEAVIKIVNVMGKDGLAIVLNKNLKDENFYSLQEEQRLNAVEQTLGRLLSATDNSPGIIPQQAAVDNSGTESALYKSLLREQAVNVMSLSLACWTSDLGKSKLDMAEESKIWPVYMDKSTPTMRTLDKYLNISSCPKNPRNQRVIDTAEFVLRKTKKSDSLKHHELQQALDAFRQLISGIS